MNTTEASAAVAHETTGNGSNGTASKAADVASELPQWGRVLIAGGTDWSQLGRKVQERSADHPDLPSPHILRDVAHEKMVRIFSGHSACHAFFLNDQGDVYVLGRNEHGQLGLPKDAKSAGSQGETSACGPIIYTATRLDRQAHFKPALPPGKDGDIVHVACGRHHTLLCTRNGIAYAAGLNSSGQCGNKAMQQNNGDLEGFRKIESAPFLKEKDAVVMVAAGITFSLILTQSGKVYGVGSTEKGQLGNGRTGEHFVSGNKTAFTTHTEPLLIRALADKKIASISCGQQHSVAMDEEGYCYVWGFGGYGRLGIGQQQDQLLPVLVPQFARDNLLTHASQVVAGPACTVVIDRQKQYWLAGKWKTTGDGGAGQGFMTFKYLPELMGCKMQHASLGGVTLIAVADEDPAHAGPHKATMNIAFGQSAANGELGLGFDKPRSATKPLRCESLDGIAILDVACGQNTTFYIARNMGDAYAELPSFPLAPDSSEACLVCNKGEDVDDESNALLECEKCEEPWHLRCLKLGAVPDGEWHCPNCIALVLDRSKPETIKGKPGPKKRPAQGSDAMQNKKVKAAKAAA